MERWQEEVEWGQAHQWGRKVLQGVRDWLPDGLHNIPAQAELQSGPLNDRTPPSGFCLGCEMHTHTHVCTHLFDMKSDSWTTRDLGNFLCSRSEPTPVTSQ